MQMNNPFGSDPFNDIPFMDDGDEDDIFSRNHFGGSFQQTHHVVIRPTGNSMNPFFNPIDNNKWLQQRKFSCVNICAKFDAWSQWWKAHEKYHCVNYIIVGIGRSVHLEFMSMQMKICTNFEHVFSLMWRDSCIDINFSWGILQACAYVTWTFPNIWYFIVWEKNMMLLKLNWIISKKDCIELIDSQSLHLNTYIVILTNLIELDKYIFLGILMLTN